MRKLSNIQVLRGLAALAVVVFHARDEANGLGLPTNLPSFVSGAFGVDVFFVISGLVMVCASASLFGNFDSVLPFLFRRFVRIAPLYWFVTVLFVLFNYADARGMLDRLSFMRFVALSLAFVPYTMPANDDAFPIYPLGWTLNYEMAFYVCFAFVLALPRRGAITVLACSLAGLVALNFLIALPGWLSYLGATQILEFLAGLIIAEMTLSGWRMPRLPAAALAVAALGAVLVAVPYQDSWWGTWRGIVWGLPAAAIVGAAALCPPVSQAGLVRRCFERLGDASYALYLVHYGLYIAVEAALGRVVDLSRVPVMPFMVILIAVAIATSFVVHRLFEVPVTQWLQNRISNRHVQSRNLK